MGDAARAVGVGDPARGSEAVRALTSGTSRTSTSDSTLLVARHPDVVLADWAAVSNASGLTYDAMHLTSEGIRLMIDTIRQAGGI